MYPKQGKKSDAGELANHFSSAG